MNPVNLPLFILFFSGVYLSSIYGLLAIAQMQKFGKNIVVNNIHDQNKSLETL